MPDENTSPLLDAPRPAMIAVRGLGLFAGGIGLYEAYGFIQTVIHQLTATPLSFFIFGDVIDLLMAVFAIWCIWACYRSWRPAPTPPVRSLSAITAIFVLTVGVMLIDFSGSPKFGSKQDAWRSIQSFIVICLAAETYIILSWCLSASLGIRKYGRRIPVFINVTLGFFLWQTSFQVLMYLAPKDSQFPHTPRGWWLPIAIIGPIVIAFGFARLMKRIGAPSERFRIGAPNEIGATEPCQESASKD